MNEAIKRAKRSKCKSCWGKGFSTQLIAGTEGWTDFGALRKIKFSGIEVVKHYCTCAKGKRLSKK